MSSTTRKGLIVIGLLIICCSLAVLIWISWPTEIDSILVTLEPTLFTSP
ncbi:MAG: hypothetical protein ACK2U1_06150 [Anaerolineales bacterium]